MTFRNTCYGIVYYFKRLAVLSPYYNSAFHIFSITYVYFHKLYYVNYRSVCTNIIFFIKGMHLTMKSIF